ncbi:hypothetical protein EMIHUDRAFT_470320 [Emiliania huxleyi CCMP1516]|uniref:Plastid lipid-associated protein/fibrillin conserved domain-containing protein n=2 Tax=Emiliania huxleyi TaxID=2903 RepID=A0A0D3J0X3_EMIH1|nr:hypothetical protein EMIHUDRAFT_470320 [Emiliania huxleyi CCMP1516]EOD17158.1 hypothetical protein EMIHUDRAFT_470320 [Emiliania huxleyi CCMP1516]|eukprot:XP_005769587.1 hypothetical protein EMIHUDRAFT_470320 [Emiliania huxleyi CCMP1516]
MDSSSALRLSLLASSILRFAAPYQLRAAPACVPAARASPALGFFDDLKKGFEAAGASNAPPAEEPEGQAGAPPAAPVPTFLGALKSGLAGLVKEQTEEERLAERIRSGEGVVWSCDYSRAWRAVKGMPQDELSLVESVELARELSAPIPNEVEEVLAARGGGSRSSRAGGSPPRMALRWRDEEEAVPAAFSRRAALFLAAGSAAGATRPPLAAAEDAAPSERRALLEAIAAGAAPPLSLGGRAARSDALGGTWRLLWSYKADKFSPLLGLPRPVRPASLQLLGPAATGTVGEGRVANLLLFPFGVRLLLSSGVLPAADGPPSTLEIMPPFRLELDAAGRRRLLVEAGSDADFRALNARDAEAQAAPRNRYAQSYLETSGRAGDLRVSTVVSGDPVIVGSVFVHERVI